MCELTIKEQLLKAGLYESEIDTHESDLYVKVNDISTKFVNNYEFKKSVTTFKDEIDHELWYEIPFGNEEFYNKKLLAKYFSEKFKHDLSNIFSPVQCNKIIKTLEKQIANREKAVLETYDSMKMEGTTILNIYSNDNEHGFGIDARIKEKTLGEIVC